MDIVAAPRSQWIACSPMRNGGCGWPLNSVVRLQLMDSAEARRVLSEKLAEYRPLPYSDLVARIEKVETLEIERAEGRPWQLEFLFYWDTEPGGNIRVIGSIDDGGLRAFAPVSDSFIKGPTGEYVGE